MLTLAKRLSTINTGNLLDVAVGRGDFLKFALATFNSYQCIAGLDIDADILQTTKNEFKSYPVVLVQASALLMPFPDSFFDTITMSNALHHIEDISKLFSETKRVCKLKGTVIINEMLNETNPMVDESYLLYHRFISSIDNQLGRFHRDTYTLKELLNIISNTNFQLLDYFIHSEESSNIMNESEIDEISDRLLKKVLLLKDSGYYYFYENKAVEIINHLKKIGIRRPRHVTFFLQIQ